MLCVLADLTSSVSAIKIRLYFCPFLKPVLLFSQNVIFDIPSRNLVFTINSSMYCSVIFFFAVLMSQIRFPCNQKCQNPVPGEQGKQIVGQEGAMSRVAALRPFPSELVSWQPPFAHPHASLLAATIIFSFISSSY